MHRQNESVGELLFKLPWWISATIGVLVFISLRWGFPILAGNDKNLQLFSNGVAPLAPLALIFFGIFAAGSFWFDKRRHRLVDEQTGLESLRNIPWKDFEFLVADSY